VEKAKYLRPPPVREILVKSEDDTDFSYGWIPEERPTEVYLRYSIINLDKPVGPSSHEVVAWLKRILGVERLAHAGTLDPKVSGVLPIVLYNSVRVLPVLLKEDKEYICVMRLHSDAEESKVAEAVGLFQGPIYQRPPLRSAVKRSLRVRRIFGIRLLEVKGRNVLLHVWCEAGTYMRKLCHDIGEVLGVGAHMQELRRIRSGDLTEDNSIATLHDVVDAFYIWKEEGGEEYLRKTFIPVERAVQSLPKVWIRDSAVDAVCRGAPLAAPGVVKLEEGIRTGDIIAIMSLKGELVAIGEAAMSSDRMLAVKSGIVARPRHVVMDPGVYPKGWRSS